MCVNEFAPVDRFERRSFINNLSLSVDVFMYRMAYGGSIGTLTYIWKIDPSLLTMKNEMLMPCCL